MAKQISPKKTYEYHMIEELFQVMQKKNSEKNGHVRRVRRNDRGVGGINRNRYGENILLVPARTYPFIFSAYGERGSAHFFSLLRREKVRRQKNGGAASRTLTPAHGAR